MRRDLAGEEKMREIETMITGARLHSPFKTALFGGGDL